MKRTWIPRNGVLVTRGGRQKFVKYELRHNNNIVICLYDVCAAATERIIIIIVYNINVNAVIARNWIWFVRLCFFWTLLTSKKDVVNVNYCALNNNNNLLKIKSLSVVPINYLHIIRSYRYRCIVKTVS